MTTHLVTRSLALVAVAVLAAACASTETPNSSGSGGTASSTGGSTTASGGMSGGGQSGGANAGGSATGGNPTGGQQGSSGGTSSGGAPSGGNAVSGGTSSGGRASGGQPTGGTSSGGTATGGQPTGGTGTGGKATGGNATGGTNTGGKATGGSATGGGSSTCPSPALAAGDSNRTVTVGSLNRTYVLHIPTGYTGTKAVPMVIDFHPLGGTGSGWEGSNPWKAKADANGFIMAYPDSYNSNNSWNAGMCCQNAQQNSIDDVGFARALVKQVEAIACVDPKRIYATGCSNGGGMTYKVACDAADIIAAAAPVDFRCVYGGTTASPSCQGCSPSRPISITHFDNTGDTSLVPYNGGMTSFAADCPPNQTCTGMGFPSAAANFTTWQTIDQCTGSTSALSGHSACQANSACQGSAQVTMCVQQGGSHCGNYSSLGIVDIAWEMFQKESLP
jgi:polyhydroxybutyrate depolymerase